MYFTKSESSTYVEVRMAVTVRILRRDEDASRAGASRLLSPMTIDTLPTDCSGVRSPLPCSLVIHSDIDCPSHLFRVTMSGR